jgi:hypothetical protein
MGMPFVSGKNLAQARDQRREWMVDEGRNRHRSKPTFK